MESIFNRLFYYTPFLLGLLGAKVLRFLIIDLPYPVLPKWCKRNILKSKKFEKQQIRDHNSFLVIVFGTKVFFLLFFLSLISLGTVFTQFMIKNGFEKIFGLGVGVYVIVISIFIPIFGFFYYILRNNNYLRYAEIFDMESKSKKIAWTIVSILIYIFWFLSIPLSFVFTEMIHNCM